MDLGWQGRLQQSESRRMRLMQVMLSPGDGGAETFFEKLALAFRERGMEQRVVICRHAERARRLREGGCEVVEIPAQGLQKWLAKGRVRRICNEYRPDVAMAWMSRAAGALSRRLGTVNVARLGGYYPLKYYRACDYLVGNTPGVVKYLVNSGWPEEKTGLISNFGEVPDRSGAKDLRGELSVPEGATVLLAIGRLHDNKAHDVGLRALAELPDCVLLVVGSGGLDAELKSLAGELGVEERVRFLGWRRDVENLYATADVCLFPSRVEPLGNVVLEAWAFGVPIVAAASEGPAWLIDEGENGMLFPIDDAQAGAAAVRKVLEDSALTEKLVSGGRAKWEAGFTREVILGEYEQLFERLRVK